MNLFRNSIRNESKLYARIRDYEKDSSVKNQIEKFWKKFETYAPPKYLEKLQSEGNFHQRWWEMFLGVGLLNLNFKIETSSREEVPDFLINSNSQKIWIEAVAPNIGSNNDALPEFLEGVHKLPEVEFLLRLTNSLNSKLDVFNNYREKNLVSDNDYCIIAVSSCALNQYGGLMNFPAPAPLKILAGAGNLVLAKDSNYLQYRTKIYKSSGSQVKTNLFYLNEYSKICAVLYSHSDPLNSPDKPETTFQLFLNPFNPSTVSSSLLKYFNDIEIWNHIKSEEYIIWQKNRS